MFYKRQPTAPSSWQNAVSRNNCRCCFWDFEREIPVRFWSTRTEKQATSDRERTISLLPVRAHCCRFQLVLLRYSTGETAPDGILVFVWFCWNRISGQRVVRRRAEWISKLSSVNVFCFDSRACCLRYDSSRCSSDVCTLGQLREREIVTGEIKLLIRLLMRYMHLAFELCNGCYFR